MIMLSGPDQETEPNGTALVASPDHVIVLVVLEHSLLARLSFDTHRTDAEPTSIE
jgi:hypothetical protein